MNQIKYLIYSVLILICLAFGFLIYSSFSETKPATLIVNKIQQNTIATSEPLGKKIFQQNCQSCHALDKKLSGPALRGLTERGPWTNRANIYKWIHNPAAFMVTNLYARELQKEYGQIMPPFNHLSEKDIDAIIDYISTASEPLPVALH